MVQLIGGDLEMEIHPSYIFYKIELSGVEMLLTFEMEVIVKLPAALA